MGVDLRLARLLRTNHRPRSAARAACAGTTSALLVCALALACATTQAGQGARAHGPSSLNGGRAGGGSLSVLVRDVNDKAVAGAQVFLFCAADPPGSESCAGVAGPLFTNADGRASMQGLPRGEFTVQVRARDEQREWKVKMTPGGSAGNTIEFDFAQ